MKKILLFCLVILSISSCNKEQSMEEKVGSFVERKYDDYELTEVKLADSINSIAQKEIIKQEIEKIESDIKKIDNKSAMELFAPDIKNYINQLSDLLRCNDYIFTYYNVKMDIDKEYELKTIVRVDYSKKTPVLSLVEKIDRGKVIREYESLRFKYGSAIYKIALLANSSQQEIENEIQKANLLKRRQAEEHAKQEAAYAKIRKVMDKYNCNMSQAEMIQKHQVALGMTGLMCQGAWGRPQRINKTITEYGVHEQWVYSLSCYLYFENNKLVTIQK